MGNQAIALGALYAGVNIVCGYPGTPSSEVLEAVAAWAREQQDGDAGAPYPHVEWSTNEKAALEVAAGAAFAGARALVTMKQVGLNVASDPLMTLAYLGVKGGLVLLVADDPGPISSQTEQDTRQFAAFAKIPLYDPSTPEEAFAMVQDAFELSEKYGIPVIVRPTTRVCHGSAPVETAFAYTPHPVEGFVRDPRWVIFPRLANAAHQQMPARFSKIANEFSEYEGNRVELVAVRSAENDIPKKPLGIAAGGVSYAYLMDALGSLDEGVTANLRVFKVATPFPFPEQRALGFLDGVDEVLVFEELEPVIERELLQLVGAHHLRANIRGKLTGDTAVAGENSVSLIAQQLEAFLLASLHKTQRINDVCSADMDSRPTAKNDSKEAGAVLSSDTPPSLPARAPVLCAGCPHRASFAAVKRALRGRAATFSGDIGCYTLGNAQPLDMVDTCICMGAGFTVPQGLHWAQPDVAHLGFVGDSTFFASGLTGVANAVYNQAPVTFIVLDNAITAMTGAQPHPGTGIRMSANATPADAEGAIDIPTVLRALGVKHVATCDPLDFKQAVATVRTAVDFPGASAVVFKSPCITVSKPGPLPVVDADTCTLCRVCLNTLGCPALVVRGEAVAVDTTLCYGCDLCVQICPFDAIQRASVSVQQGDAPLSLKDDASLARKDSRASRKNNSTAGDA